MLYRSQKDKRFFDFIKIPENEVIDLIFMNYNYYHKTTTKDKFEYCGFYNKIDDKLYDISYSLRNGFLNIPYDDETYKDMEILLKEFNTKISELVTEHVKEISDDLKNKVVDYEPNIKNYEVYDDIMNSRKK